MSKSGEILFFLNLSKREKERWTPKNKNNKNKTKHSQTYYTNQNVTRHLKTKKAKLEGRKGARQHPQNHESPDETELQSFFLRF